MDGDLQNNPADIAALYGRFQAGTPGSRLAVLGQRTVRNDRVAQAAVVTPGERIARGSAEGWNTRYGMQPQAHPPRRLPRASVLRSRASVSSGDAALRNGVESAHVEVSHRSRINGHSKYGFGIEPHRRCRPDGGRLAVVAQIACRLRTDRDHENGTAMTQASIWLGIGFLGQSPFFMRFFVQCGSCRSVAGKASCPTLSGISVSWAASRFCVRHLPA